MRPEDLRPSDLKIDPRIDDLFEIPTAPFGLRHCTCTPLQVTPNPNRAQRRTLKRRTGFTDKELAEHAGKFVHTRGCRLSRLSKEWAARHAPRCLVEEELGPFSERIEPGDFRRAMGKEAA